MEDLKCCESVLFEDIVSELSFDRYRKRLDLLSVLGFDDKTMLEVDSLRRNYNLGKFYLLLQPLTRYILALTHHQQKAFENIVGKGEIIRNEQFLLFPQCFLLNQIIVSSFVNSILSSYLYLLRNRKSLKLAYQVNG